jgi:N-carbamoylputrescine amidase
MAKGKVKIAMIQHSCGLDRNENVNKAIRLIREAASKGAKIICTQELFATQYFCQTVDFEKYDWAEPIPGPTSNQIRELAMELSVVIVCCIFEYAMDGLYFTSAVVFDADGANLGTYRKHHIPEGPQYIEKYYFAPGDSPYKVYHSKYGTFGVLICWDQWFPEPSRILAIKGADFIFYPSIIGAEPDFPELDTCQNWIDAVKAHGIHNNIYIAALNRLGREDATDGSGFMSFYGNSFVSDPNGSIIAEGCKDQDEAIVCEIDFDLLQKVRDKRPFLNSRRVDSYEEILRMHIKQS